MKTLLVFCFIFGLASAQDGMPAFQWDDKEVSSSGVPLLNVFYPDGASDAIDLKKVSSEACIFTGYLRKEPTSYVAMSGGCPFSNSFEIQFHSSHLPNTLAYKVQNGVVSLVRSPYERADLREEKFAVDLFVEKRNKATDRITFPVNGYAITIKFYYDQLFKTRFAADVTARLDAVSAFAQGFYLLPSLTTKLNFIKTPHQEVPISFTDGASDPTLETLRQYVTDSSINANVFMTSRGDQAGVVGLAWVGTVCFGNITFRASINEYYVSDASTGQIVAHEMGHNLGMQHDFLNGDPTQPRLDSKSNTCSGIGGVMDYFQKVFDKWSTCSVEDFQKLVDSYGASFCLAPSSASGNDTTTTTTATSTSSDTTITTTTTTTTTSATPTTTATTTSTASTSPPISTTTTTIKTTTSTTVSSVGKKCIDIGGSRCRELCRKVNFSPAAVCRSFIPTKFDCSCNLFGTPTTTTAPAFTTLSAAQKLCKTSPGTCSATCKRMNYSGSSVCRIPGAVCICSWLKP